MGRWWWLLAAAAVLGGWWWWRQRDRALKGLAKTTPAPQGATAGGALAALQVEHSKKIAGQKSAISGSRSDSSAFVPLPMVGAGSVVPSTPVNSASQAKPSPPPAATATASWGWRTN